MSLLDLFGPETMTNLTTAPKKQLKCNSFTKNLNLVNVSTYLSFYVISAPKKIVNELNADKPKNTLV